GGKDAAGRCGGEFAIKRFNHTKLVLVVYEPANKHPKISPRFGNARAMAGDIGNNHAHHFPAATRRDIVDIAARRLILAWLTVDPCIDPGHDHAAVDGPIATP